MICPKCGLEMNDNAAVCPGCGEVLGNENMAAEEISDTKVEMDAGTVEESGTSDTANEEHIDAEPPVADIRPEPSDEDGIQEMSEPEEDHSEEVTDLSEGMDEDDDTQEIVNVEDGNRKSYVYIITGVLVLALLAGLVYYFFFKRPDGVSKAYYDKSITLMDKVKNSLDTIKSEAAELKGTSQQGKTETELNTEVQTYSEELQGTTLTQQEKFMGRVTSTVVSFYLYYTKYQALAEEPVATLMQNGLSSKEDALLLSDAIKKNTDVVYKMARSARTLGALEKAYGVFNYHYIELENIQKTITEKVQQQQPAPTAPPTAIPTSKATAKK